MDEEDEEKNDWGGFKKAHKEEKPKKSLKTEEKKENSRI